MAERKNSKSSIAFQLGSNLVRYQMEELPTSLDSPTGDYTLYNLRAFEAWVASNLSRWLEFYKGIYSTCGKLGHLIRSYYSVVCLFYSNNTKATSIMLLTILEL